MKLLLSASWIELALVSTITLVTGGLIISLFFIAAGAINNPAVNGINGAKFVGMLRLDGFVAVGQAFSACLGAAFWVCVRRFLVRRRR